MSLTASQLTTFKTAILAETDPALVAARNAHSDQGIADWYNGDHASQMLWRPDVAVADALSQVVWSDFEALTQGKRDCWFAIVSGAIVDATKANIRSGFSSIFGVGSSSLTNLQTLGQRKATRFEVLFTVSSVCSLFGYRVSATDVALALAS